MNRLPQLIVGHLGGTRLLLLPAALFLIVFYVVPLSDVIALSVTEPELSLGNFIKLYEKSLYHRILFTTFEISLLEGVAR